MDLSWEYINCSQAHECGWKGRSVSFPGTHKSDLLCNVVFLENVNIHLCNTFLNVDTVDGCNVICMFTKPYIGKYFQIKVGQDAIFTYINNISFFTN